MCPQNLDSLIDPSKDLLIDPSITPHTWNLDRNIGKYIETLEAGKKQNDQYDIICFPGHSLIINTTELLFLLGSPGYNSTEMPENQPIDDWFNILSRGLTSPNIFASFLPSIGRHILHLWLIRCFIQTGNSKWNLGKVSFTWNISDESLQSYPSLDCGAIELEWIWISEFLTLSALLCEPNLDLIPAFWGGSREDTIEHPLWKERRLALLSCYSHLPYTFSHEGDHKIIATAQGTDLYLMSIYLMAECEKEIRRVIEMMILPTWEKMRSQGNLRQDQIDKILQTRMNWQINQWPDPFIKDGKLSATAGYAAYIGNHKDSELKDWMEKIRKRLEKTYKRRDGIRPGNVGRREMELDLEHEKQIFDLGPDLVKILSVAWPIVNISEQKKQVKKLTLEKIRAQHFNFSWSKVKANDRLDFLSKIVHLYLWDTSGKEYAYKILRAPIKKILSKEP